MNRGYVNLWRKTQDTAVFQNEGLFKVFVWCLWRAAWKETYVAIKTGRGISEVKLVPGQFIFGRESAAKELKMSPSTVWKRILKLKKLDFLNIESNSHYSIITIINWHIYQQEKKNKDSESDRQGTGKEHKEALKTLKKEKKKINTYMEIPSFDDVLKYCKERNNNVDVNAWFDHYISNGWMVGKNKMQDWKAAVRTWEHKNSNGGKNHGYSDSTIKPYAEKGSAGGVEYRECVDVEASE